LNCFLLKCNLNHTLNITPRGGRGGGGKEGEERKIKELTRTRDVPTVSASKPTLTEEVLLYLTDISLLIKLFSESEN
jgi:hypothetical protein